MKRVDLAFTGRKSACFTSNSGIRCLYWGPKPQKRRILMDWAKVILVIVSVAASIAASALDDDSKD
jgi:hypothetical protein